MTEADREIFYEAVSAHPDGRSTSTAARLARTACEQGYGGVVLRADPERETAGGPASPAEIADDYGIDVVEGIEIRTDAPGSASGALGEYRAEYTLVILAGGTEAMNRFAAEEPRVDVLARPMAGRGDVDHVVAKAAARNGVRIEFDFSSVLRTSGGRRVQALSGLRKLRELVEKYDVPYVVSAGAGSHLELRAPWELAAVGEAIGFPREAVLEGLREWGRLAARNRDLQGGSFIEPGVREGRYGEQS